MQLVKFFINKGIYKKPINVEAYKRIHENSQLAFCIVQTM